MSATVLVYIGMLIALFGASIWLILRDLNTARQEEEQERLANEPALRRLPTPIEDTPAQGVPDRIDQSFRRLIYQTGIEVSAEPVFLLIVLCGLALGGGIFVWRDDLVQAIAVGFVGAAIPLGVFVYLRNTRLREIREQLPDVMDLMARAVRAGESLDQAIASVGHNAKAPLAVEFQRCARHLDMGLAMPAAMRSLTRRAPITEMRILSATFNVQRRSGGNLAITLDRLAGVIRDRLSYRRQFMAATGASRMATILIALAGPLVFTLMMLWQPDYMGQFFDLPGGHILLAMAGILELVGLVWVFGLMRNDY